MAQALDTTAIRADFPILDQQVNGQPLIYLDNAATSQTPLSVLASYEQYYKGYNANIHRGAHKLAREATEKFEAARQNLARHINAADDREIIFTSGVTDSINLVANILSLSGEITADHNVIISGLEHHSNIVPWQMLCERTGAELRVIPILDNGTFDMPAFDQLIDKNTAVVSVNHYSNSLGTRNPIEDIIAAAKKVDAYTCIDGAQSAPHERIDVQSLDCDFYTISGHKMYGPTGTGLLYGRTQVLEKMPPWRGGGEMIKLVTFEKTTYNELPFKYEAGTPNIEGAIAFSAAADYVNQIGLENIAAHERHLAKIATEGLLEIDGLRIYGTAAEKAAVISFLVDGVHHYDLGTLLDQMGVAVRTGHHCCQPLMARFGITGTVRASFAMYNTEQEAEAFVKSTQRAINMLR
ncbi:aminotransferase class V-fold PLP-dependent enzyme [Persicirhabdus sediminis]|uniref:Cysteine desulfurase n=1 Tax=Persicirhabdus sediminis TaxID=454144 RepID=A0A8J7SJF4_9BACT|nr:cysteine desulfurase [Persicirhabdus sediminis]MBK1791081.1 cysteine desulfurase [Persicirhabdus sediminis]